VRCTWLYEAQIRAAFRRRASGGDDGRLRFVEEDVERWIKVRDA
jgi:hypothetical protein